MPNLPSKNFCIWINSKPPFSIYRKGLIFAIIPKDEETSFLRLDYSVSNLREELYQRFRVQTIYECPCSKHP